MRSEENGKLIFQFVQGNVDGEDLIVCSMEKGLVRISRVGFEIVDVAQVFFQVSRTSLERQPLNWLLMLLLLGNEYKVVFELGCNVIVVLGNEV